MHIKRNGSCFACSINISCANSIMINTAFQVLQILKFHSPLNKPRSAKRIVCLLYRAQRQLLIQQILVLWRRLSNRKSLKVLVIIITSGIFMKIPINSNKQNLRAREELPVLYHRKIGCCFCIIYI